MPALGHDTAAASAIPNDGSLVVVAGRLRLRRMASDGTYDPSAPLPVSGVATFPNLAASGASALWGFEVTADTTGTNAGTIDFQFSEDDGVTWRFWSGVAWAAAVGANDWSSVATVQANIASFPIGKGPKRGIRMRVRLRPGTKDTTPSLSDAWFLVEYNHDPVVDVVRSVCTSLAAVRYPLYVVERSTGTNQVPLSMTACGYALDTTKPIAVYNVTADPGFGTNLFAAYAAGVVTMTGVQPIGNLLRVVFQGGLPVTPVPNAMFYDAVVPSVHVALTVREDSDQSGGVVSEINPAASISTARERAGPRYLKIGLLVSATDDDEERAYTVGGVLRRALHAGAGITSLATAQAWPVADVSGVQIRPSFADRVHGVTVGGTLWVREDTAAYTSFSLAKQIKLRISDQTVKTWYDEHAVAS